MDGVDNFFSHGRWNNRKIGEYFTTGLFISVEEHVVVDVHAGCVLVECAYKMERVGMTWLM